MSDALIAKGQVDIKVFKDGVEIDRLQDNNLVVTLGKTNIAKLLGGDVAGKAITKIAVGTSSAPAAVGNNSITGAFSKALTGVSYPNANSIMFAFDIDNAEANGMTIWEFGLLNEDDILFARKVRDSSIEKTAAIRLVGTWTITVN